MSASERRAALAAIPDEWQGRRRQVLELMIAAGPDGMTNRELATHLGIEPGDVTSVTRLLLLLRWLEEAGFRPGLTGLRNRVRRLAPAGGRLYELPEAATTRRYVFRVVAGREDELAQMSPRLLGMREQTTLANRWRSQGIGPVFRLTITRKGPSVLPV